MANPSIDRDGVVWLRQQLQEAHPDLLREMLATMVQELMGAEARALCGAEYGKPSSERTNRRNGYRERDWDTGSAASASPCPSCAWAAISRAGCWSRGGGRNGLTGLTYNLSGEQWGISIFFRDGFGGGEATDEGDRPVPWRDQLPEPEPGLGWFSTCSSPALVA